VPGAAASFFGAVSEKVLESSVPVSEDEVRFQQRGTEEIMEIRASRRRRNGIHCGWFGFRRITTGWKIVPSARGDGRSVTRCGSCRRECPDERYSCMNRKAQ
jgi:hypothetical protein